MVQWVVRKSSRQLAQRPSRQVSNGVGVVWETCHTQVLINRAKHKQHLHEQQLLNDKHCQMNGKDSSLLSRRAFMLNSPSVR